VYKRCQCRDANGRRAKSCRKAHGSWAFTIDAGTDPTTGKRKQIVRSGFRTRDEAEEEMTGLLAAVNAGTWTDDQGMTLGTFLDLWLAEQVSRGGSPTTLAGYRRHIEKVWKPRLGNVRLRDLRREHIEKVLAEMAKPQDGERPPGNSGSFVRKREAGTIDSYRRTLRAALSVAVRRGRIPINHAQGRMEAIPQRKPKESGPIWEPDETARFLEHVADDRLAALYELAAYAGLRRAELCGARWSDLDDDEGGTTVRQTCVELTRNQAERGEDLLCRTCGEVHVGRILKEPKTNRSWRWVPLSAPAQASLTAHREAQQAEREMFGDDYNDHDLIFCQPDGVPLRPKTVTEAFADHAAACKLPVIRLHDMRHGACSLLLAGGVPIEVVQMILGHASPEVTRRIYAHVMKKITAEQVERATKLLTRHRREQHPSGAPESTGPTPAT
jgi:integrase